MDIEKGTFTSLVLTVYGSPGKECDKFIKILAHKLSVKQNEKCD